VGGEGTMERNGNCQMVLGLGERYKKDSLGK
jgi:hypothetical protein